MRFFLPVIGAIAAEARGRLTRAFWKWLAGKVNPFIPPRYGVTLSNNVLRTSGDVPAITIQHGTLTIADPIHLSRDEVRA